MHVTHRIPYHLSFKTYQLMLRMLNPLCGLIQEIGFIKRSQFASRIFTVGAEICGVHHLLNRPDPGRGAYHIGGSGIKFNEAIIKSLGETIERYSQLMAEKKFTDKFVFCNYEEMQTKYSNILSTNFFNLHSKEQYKKKNFPFQAFHQLLPLSWYEMRSLANSNTLYVPAQFLFVGYQLKAGSEPWYGTAVTTGTAAHTHFEAALINAILELIQIDAAMGHWYGNFPIYEIVFDKRARLIQNIIFKYGSKVNEPRFFWLRNPDLKGISIACLLEQPNIPRFSIGLGSSLKLNDAMYKAYLEAIGVQNLGQLLILKAAQQETISSVDQEEIYDIDTNVALYARGIYEAIIKDKFNAHNKINASDIDADFSGHINSQLKYLIKSFVDTNKDLLFCDLSHTEAKELGFYVPRLWSKDLLSLCFPSAPPKNHPRFLAYGGFSNDTPHPYP